MSKLIDYLIALESGKRDKGGAVLEGIPSLGAEHLDNNGGFNLKLKKLKYISEDLYVSLRKGIIKDGDVLLVKDGATTGKVSYVSNDFPLHKAAINEHLFLLRSNKEMNSKYLFYFLFSSIGRKKVMSDFRGATVGGISKQFVNMEIVVPSIIKQKKIVQVLDKAQELIDKRKKQIEALDELIKSIFYDMFGDPVINNMKWSHKLLKKLGSFKNGVNYKQTDEGLQIRCISVKDFKDNIYIHEDHNISNINILDRLKSEYLLEKNDIIFVRSNGSKDLVGRGVLIKGVKEKTTFSGFCIRFRTVTSFIDPVYLIILFSSVSFKNYIKKDSRGCSINNLNQQMLSDLKIPIPPIELQNKFASIVEEIEKQKEVLQESLKELEDNFNCLMQKAFKGELFN